VPKGSQADRDLQEVVRAGRRARDLVSQILTFSRQTQQELKPLDPVPIIKEVMKLLRASILQPLTSGNASRRPTPMCWPTPPRSTRS